MRNVSNHRIRVLTAFILSTSFVATGLYFSPSKPPQLLEEILELRRDILERYRVKVSLYSRPEPDGFGHSPINANKPNLADAQVVLRLLQSELALYPRDFIRKNLFKNIVLCGYLNQDDQEKGAISDFTHDTLYLNLSDGDTVEYKRRDIHHEIFHMIDGKDDGRFEDEAWCELNLPAFRYGNGHGREWIETPGFLSGYSTQDAAEDKAELFSYMMTLNASVRDRAERDPIICRKIAALEKFLVNLCPEIDATFWLRANRHRQSVRSEKESCRQLEHARM